METLVTSNAELNASVGFLGKVALARPTYRSVYDNADKIMRRSISYFPHRVIFSFPLKHATLSTAKKDSRDQSRGARFVVSLSLFLLLPLLFSFSPSPSLRHLRYRLSPLSVRSFACRVSLRSTDFRVSVTFSLPCASNGTCSNGNATTTGNEYSEPQRLLLLPPSSITFAKIAISRCT